MRFSLLSLLMGALACGLAAAEREYSEYSTCPTVAHDLLRWQKVEVESPSDRRMEKTRAIAVDPETGALYSLKGRTGVFKSMDQGSNWEQIADTSEMAGSYWYGIALHRDRSTGGIALFLKDPQEEPLQCVISLDDGGTWHPIKRVLIEGDHLRSYGWSWGQVDWANNPRRMLGKLHHSSRLWFSEDGGANWREIENTDYFGFAPDGSILIAKPTSGTILRSTDNGAEWETVADDIAIHAFRPVIFEKSIYWLGEGGLFQADATGTHWKTVGSELPHAYWGPFFGETKKGIIVGTREGIYHSQEGGDLWTKIADNPIMLAEAKKEKPTSHNWLIGRNTFGWDVKNNILFLADGNLHKLDLKPLAE